MLSVSSQAWLDHCRGNSDPKQAWQHRMTGMVQVTGDALCQAAAAGDLAELTKLVNAQTQTKGAGVHTILATPSALLGAQPLHAAAEHGHEHIVKAWRLLHVLLSLHCTPLRALLATAFKHVCTAAHVSPLQAPRLSLCGRVHSCAAVQYILEQQLYPSAGDGNFVSPLQLAALKGHIGIVTQLLRAGANVQMADRDGDSALHWAAHNGEVQVQRLYPLACAAQHNTPAQSNVSTAIACRTPR